MGVKSMEIPDLAPEQVDVAEANDAPAGAEPRKIVICFDGTSNQFHGTKGDTNVVKIFEMLDRNTGDQYHYYQPGIGTQPITPLSGSSPLNFLRPSFLKATLDQGFAFSFVDHVLGGYKFLMQTYLPGDKVYIFGFSRGSYTARFLAEMIQWIGLLSRGNEELVRWAWATFSEFQAHRDDKDFDNPAPDSDCAKAKDFMMKFKSAFCRNQVDIHFLGLFDCVNSVAQFESPFSRSSSPYIPIPMAKHIRHAVSIHERRMKFRPALLWSKEFAKQIQHEIDDDSVIRKSLKEVYFAGNHGDVGGGWDLETGKNGQIKYLLSDIPLKWMIDELREIDEAPAIGEVIKEFEAAVVKTGKTGLKESERNLLEAQIFQSMSGKDAPRGLSWQWAGETGLYQRAKFAEMLELELYVKCDHPPSSFRKLLHDPLRFGAGCSPLKVMFWWVLEILPFKRYELKNKVWTSHHWPPTFGDRRDIPENSTYHPSVALLNKALIVLDQEMPLEGGSGGLAARFRRWLDRGKKQDKKDL